MRTTKLLILKGFPDERTRGELWYIASHAKKEQNEHSSNYYNFLALTFPRDVPLINEKQIDLDIIPDNRND